MSGGPIWLVGCGNMAGAMLDGWLAAGVPPERFTVVRPSGKPPAPGVRTLTAPPTDGPPPGPPPGIVMLGVKPHQLRDVAPSLAPLLAPGTILVSILAGVEVASLRRDFPGADAIVRAMPNLPVRLRSGVVGLVADQVGSEAHDEITALMTMLGLAIWVEDEPALDAVSVLAGSGPAFVYRFIDALAAAGVAIGLARDRSERLALATVEGAARLAAGAGETPGRLADRVASPGGSTRSGLDVLDAHGALVELVTATLEASRRRVEEMAAEARVPNG